MKIKIQRNYWLYFLLAFLFFPPKIISLIPSWHSFYILFELFAILVTFLLILYEVAYKDIKLNYCLCIFAIFIAWLEFVTILHASIGRSFLMQILPAVGLMVTFRQAFRKNRYKQMLGAFSFYCFLIVLLNVISQIICGSSGIYHDWTTSWQAYYICGNANSFVFFYLFAIAVIYSFAQFNHNFVRLSYIVHGLMIFSLYYTMKDGGSTTGLLIISIAMIVRLFSLNKVRDFVMKHYKAILLFLGVVGIWMFVYNGWKSEWLLNQIQTLLGDNVSFLARGTIWSNSLIKIKESPIIGYGTNSIHMSADLDGVLRSAHNNYLEITIMGGIPALLLFFMFIISCFKKPAKSKEWRDFAYGAMMVVILYLVAFFVEQEPFYPGFYASAYLFYSIKLGATIPSVRTRVQ